MEEILKKESVSELVRDVEENGEKPVQVFGDYLFKGEIGILFGDSNTGKSILANDICMAAAGGEPFWPETPKLNLPSIYVDLEMTREQFGNRFRGAVPYIPKNYQRIWCNVLNGDNTDELMNAIKREIIKTQNSPDAIKLIIIDNITYGFGSILSAKEMKALMKSLKELKDRFGLTILLIGHCVKRKSGGPVTLDDLGGTKMLANFCDSAFAINNTAIGDEVKYLKLVKSRVVQKPKKVQIVEISQEPYLRFQPKEQETEIEVLHPTNLLSARSSIKPEMEPIILQMREAGATIVQIADKIRISKSAVGRYCKLMGL